LNVDLIQAAKKPKPKRMTDLIVGDCVTVLPSLNRAYDLVIADSPYNFGMAYDAYDDKKTDAEYLAWTERWLAAVSQSMAPHASLWVFTPDEWASEIDVYARRTLGLYRRNWVIWVFTFGQAAQKGFTRSKLHLLYYVKNKGRFTFNDEVVRVPSARQALYNDWRANPRGKLPDDTWVLLGEHLGMFLTPDTDTWLQSRVCGTFKERAKESPNQIPLPIMDRIVRACSNPGDHVLDPFAGSGSSGVASALAGRRWTGIDLSKTCVEVARRRIDEARASRG
jgi:DNA modification methylase